MTEPVDVLWTGENPPGYAHPGDAGADLVSTEAFELAPGERRLVGTGVSIALPEGHAAFVVPRSGLAAKHGITIVNAPGTVDSGYRGEVKVALLNTDATTPYAVQVGDRIAQMIVMPVAQAVFTPGRHPARQRPWSGRVRLVGLRCHERAGRNAAMRIGRRKRDEVEVAEQVAGDVEVAETSPEVDIADQADAGLDEVVAVAPTGKSAPADREEVGPLDETEANPVRPYVDLGGVKILPREGLHLRLEVEEGSQRVVAVGLDYDESTLQVQPFAAPRSTGPLARDPRADRRADRAPGRLRDRGRRAVRTRAPCFRPRHGRR